MFDSFVLLMKLTDNKIKKPFSLCLLQAKITSNAHFHRSKRLNSGYDAINLLFIEKLENRMFHLACVTNWRDNLFRMINLVTCYFFHVCCNQYDQYDQYDYVFVAAVTQSTSFCFYKAFALEI